MKIAVLCGGSGPADLQKQVFNIFGYTGFDQMFSFIINGYDNGKSTGVCRNVYDTLGPSDFRKNQLRIAKIIGNGDITVEAIIEVLDKRVYADCFPASIMEFSNHILDVVDFHIDKKNLNRTKAFRFKKLMSEVTSDFVSRFHSSIYCDSTGYDTSALQDFSIGNMLYGYLAAHKFADSKTPFQDAIDFVADLIEIPKCVFVSSEHNIDLKAKTESGKVLEEYEIVDWDNSTDKIEITYFTDKTGTELKSVPRHVDVSSYDSTKGINALKSSNAVIISTGTQWSSIIPTLQSNEVVDILDFYTGGIYFFVNSFQDKDMKGYSFSEYVNAFNKAIDISARVEDECGFTFVNEFNETNSKFIMNEKTEHEIDYTDLGYDDTPFDEIDYEMMPDLSGTGYIDFNTALQKIVDETLFSSRDNNPSALKYDHIEFTDVETLCSTDTFFFDYDDTLIPRGNENNAFTNDVYRVISDLSKQKDVVIVSGNTGEKLIGLVDNNVMPIENIYACSQYNINLDGSLKLPSSGKTTLQSMYSSCKTIISRRYPALEDKMSDFGDRPLLSIRPVEYAREQLVNELSILLNDPVRNSFNGDHSLFSSTNRPTYKVSASGTSTIDITCTRFGNISKMNAIRDYYFRKDLSNASSDDADPLMIDLSSKNFAFFGDEYSLPEGNDYDVASFLEYTGKKQRFAGVRNAMQTYILISLILARMNNEEN